MFGLTIRQFLPEIKRQTKEMNQTFEFKPFSKKQLQVMTWWLDESPVHARDYLVADGAIRSGKTISMSLGFIIWSMACFANRNFAFCGNTLGSLRRNVIKPLIEMLAGLEIPYKDRIGEKILEIGNNTYYLFGGGDEASYKTIQGITLAGAFFDEVTLLTKSFVDQATARCSIDGSKLWFNCNPDGPFHWFRKEWIIPREKKNGVRIRFGLDDNLSLSDERKSYYKRLYTGIFYLRYILGKWVQAEGIIYDMFRPKRHILKTRHRDYDKKEYISVDYGTFNATVFLKWGQYKGRWICEKEYVYEGREEGTQKSDTKYADEMDKFCEGRKDMQIIVDPSAASFITELRDRGYNVIQGDNDVINGIRFVGSLLENKLLYFNDCCKYTIKEFHSYVWDDKAAKIGDDKPKKENDHAMDAVRYFCYTILKYKDEEYELEHDKNERQEAEEQVELLKSLLSAANVF